MPRWPDYRLVLLGTVLPDLIDKPFGVALDLESRLWAHTLVFFLAIMSLSLLPRFAPVRWLGFGIGTHLLLDRIWEQPEIVLWPGFGWSFPVGAPTLEQFWYTFLHDPYVQVGEAIGLAVLIAFAFIQGIRSWAALREFLRDGALRGAESKKPATTNP